MKRAALLTALVVLVVSVADAGVSADVNGSVPIGRDSAARVSAGVHHVCVLAADTQVFCWGSNVFGQLGRPGTTEHTGDAPGEMGDALTPIDLGTGRAASMVVSGSHHVCVLVDDGDVLCWGQNDSGQLGQGDQEVRGDDPGEMGDALEPVDLGTDRTATAITGGLGHTCALLDNAKVKCWGRNQEGQLGQGDTEARGDDPDEMGDTLDAVELGNGRTATAITAGANFTCALLDDGSVKCWGLNNGGVLGQGDTEFRGDDPDEMGDALDPVDLGEGRTAVALASAQSHTCVVLDDASVKCWGNGLNGKLGYGDTVTRGDGPGEMGDALLPVDLGTGRTARAVSVGAQFSCAFLDDDSVKCWGRNEHGQLGQGDLENRGDTPDEMGDDLPPIDLGDIGSVVAIEAGDVFVCVLSDSGATTCWGQNNRGQLGLGDTASRGDEAGEMGEGLIAIDLPELVGRLGITLAATAASSVVAGDMIEHEVTLENNGTITLTEVTVTSPQAPQCDRAFAVLDVGDTAQFTCQSVAGDDKVGTRTTTFSVASSQGAASTAEADTDVLDRHQVSVGLAAPGDVVARRPITYTVTVSNPGTSTLTNVIVAATNAPACGRTIATLAATSATSYTCVRATVGSDRPTVSNQVSVTSDQGAVAVSTATVTGVAKRTFRPDVSIRSRKEPFIGGGVLQAKKTTQVVRATTKRRAVVYTWRVRNTGNSSARYRLSARPTKERAAALFVVRHERGKKNITRSIRRGTYRTPLIRSGKRIDVRIRVVPRATAPSGAALTLRLHARPTTGPGDSAVIMTTRR